MPVNNLNAPPYGYSWQPAADPTGNDMQTKELVFRSEAGVVTGSGFYEQVHNTAGLRFVDMTGNGETSGAFERDSNGKLVIV